MTMCKHASTTHRTFYMRLTAILGVASFLTRGMQASNQEDKGVKVVVLPCAVNLDSAHCFCEGIDNETNSKHVTCSNISTTEQLQSMFDKLEEPTSLLSFALVNSSLKLLPAGVFGKATFKFFVLLNTTVEKIEPGIFKGMEETLTHLTIKSNKIKIIDFVSGMPLLERVSIKNESMCEEIADNAFANLRTPKSYIKISNCSIQTIGNYAFANSTSRVNISNNLVPIKKVGDNVFSSASGRVSLRNVTDSSFSTNTFTGINLKELRIEGLTTLKKEVFAVLLDNPQSDKKYFFEGFMKCDESMDWLADVDRTMFKFQCENGKTLG